MIILVISSTLSEKAILYTKTTSYTQCKVQHVHYSDDTVESFLDYPMEAEATAPTTELSLSEAVDMNAANLNRTLTDVIKKFTIHNVSIEDVTDVAGNIENTSWSPFFSVVAIAIFMGLIAFCFFRKNRRRNGVTVTLNNGVKNDLDKN